MDILKLLPEQVASLNMEATILNDQYSKLLDEHKLENRVRPQCDRQGITDIGDNLTVSRLESIRKRAKTINLYSNSYELVEEYDSEKINIGTEFTVYMDFGNNDCEKETYRLVQAIVSISEKNNYISISCPLGEAVLNKKVGDNIQYLTPNKKRVNGVVLDILPKKVIEQPKKKV